MTAKIWKRVLSALLCVCLFAGMLPIIASAENADVVSEQTAVEAQPSTVADETEVAEDTADPSIYELVRQVYDDMGDETSAPAKRAANVDEPSISDYATFIDTLNWMEVVAMAYVAEIAPGKDANGLVIKYIRTGVERYNSSSWGIMAGYEDAEFAAFVEEFNPTAMEYFGADLLALKNLVYMPTPNGQMVDMGHVFGSMDITYHNKGSMNHMDVSGWAGDICDLLTYTDGAGVTGEVEAMAKIVRTDYLGVNLEGAFGMLDILGDLDAFYFMQKLYANPTSSSPEDTGVIASIMSAYYTEDLTDEDRADYFLKNRFDGVSKLSDVRNAVYSTYTGNKVVATLEGTREFTSDDVTDLRKACCYAFADYLCMLAGDYVETGTNNYYTVFNTEVSQIAPGIKQEINYAKTADNKQQVYYIATADLTRDDVHVFANYKDNDPSLGWGMSRVTDQMASAQTRRSDPTSKYYMENYNAVVGVNASFYNMETGEPTGLLVMDGVKYHNSNNWPFFAVLKDGTAMIADASKWSSVESQVQEAVSGPIWLVKDGKIIADANSDYYVTRASRTCVGVTRTGKVVVMVLDGRQEPFSCGGTSAEIAQIMLEAGCINAINLDGGGSTTFAAKQEGSDEVSVVSRPSDGYQRSISTSLMFVSTANTSTEFDHAVLSPATDYLTVGSSVQISATGVSASGGAAEIPEGAVWELDPNVEYNLTRGTLSADGVYTASTYGVATINLVLDGTVIGTTTVECVVPDNVGFTKKNMDVVYGERVTMPVVAYYGGNVVTMNTNDVTFSLSKKDAGTFDGFTFIADESVGAKNVTVTCALATNASIKASISLALYKQGEAAFDFDQATGGDRELAWDRKVSNSTTFDEITYDIVDADQDMVTSYIFAIDMAEIPIPEQLSELTYMLPGSDVAGASAWTFLMQLAERVSPLTVVTPTITFDPNMTVDYSNITMVNEYFTLSAVDFDETTNSLKLTMRWIDQTEPVDASMSNPLCIVSGIKLTPKEGASWDKNDCLNVVNNGTISYDVYLRASALYTFSQKPENQAEFGLYPYANPDIESDKGGHFSNVYKTFRDEYTLDVSVRNGWIEENGGNYFYVDGVILTGVQKADGYYYDFGEDGNCADKAKYTGLFTADGKTYYAVLGELVSGWVSIKDTDGEFYEYYFDEKDFAMYTGVRTVNTLTYTFDDDGHLLRGAFLHYSNGKTKYFWAGKSIYYRFITLEEGTYWLDFDGYVAYGNAYTRTDNIKDITWYHFDEETGVMTGLTQGFFQYEGEDYYCDENGKIFYGAIGLEDGIILSATRGKLIKNASYYISGPSMLKNCNLEVGTYWCDANGYIVRDGFVTIGSDTFYFDNYVRAKGLTKIGEDYYLFNTGNGKMYTDSVMWVSGNNAYGLKAGYYTFQADGKMFVPDLVNGEKRIVNENGKLYFTIDGVKMTNGINELSGDFYYAQSNGVLLTDKTIWVSLHNDYLPSANGYYSFGADGKLLKTGFVSTPNGATYYYNNTVRALGFTKIGGDYYFFNAGNGRMYQDTVLWVGGNNSYGVKGGYYNFLSDGKMFVPDLENGVRRIVEENGCLYFTIDGVKMTNGINELDGEYYFAQTNGKLLTNTVSYVSATNGLLTSGNGYYAFAADGKLVKTGFVSAPNGATYYYANAVRTLGFTKIDGDYYFFNAGNGKMYQDTVLWVGGNNPYGMKGGYYTFLSDGKMFIPDLVNGTKRIVEENGSLYFTIDGVKMTNGINELDGEYYYAQSNGKLAAGGVFYVSSVNGLLTSGNGYYAFAADGKLVKTGFVTTSDGATYYYANAVRTLGFTKIGGDYYFFNAGNGKMYTSVTLWVSGSNAYGVKGGYYTFGADGKMIVS